MASNFKYECSPSGQINGESFLVQTEDVINALATQLEQTSSDASSALSGVEQAQNTANLALSTAQNAQATASANSKSITTINGALSSLQTQMTEADNALSQRIDKLQTQGDQTAGVVQNAVLFVVQSLSSPQKTQARENIAAAPIDSPVFTGNVTAQTLTVSGAINGTATAALQDGDGHDFSSFYAPLDSPVLTGNASAENLTVTGTLSATASQAIADANGNKITTTYATIANTYTKEQVDAKVSSVYRFMGSVATYDDLPSSGQTVGDTYNVEDTGANYAWTGSAWDKLSETFDLSQYLTASVAKSTYLALSGGTMKGPLILSEDPTTTMGAATKQYVDSVVSTGASNAVLFVSQTLSESQKTQARSNIGVVTLTNDGIKALGSNIDYNTVLSPGFYHINSSGASNGPGAWATKLIVLGQTVSSYVTQVAFPTVASGNVTPAWRATTNGGSTWTEWQPFAPVMVGATSSAAGSAGAVPAPAAGYQGRYLRGDGTWANPANNMVLQTPSTANGNYPLLLKETTGTRTTTDGSIFDTNIFANPSTGVVTANGFNGPLTGNASTASKWGTARTITLSGDATGSVSIDGSANVTLNLTIANSSITNGMLAANSVTFSKVNSADVATQAEAEAGTANNCFMTPVRVAQAISSLGKASYIPKTGDAGTVSAYTSVGTNTTINDASPDACQTASAVTVSNGTTNKSWTKIVRLTGTSPKVTLGSSWTWQGGKAPTLKQNGFLVLGWCGSGGLAVFNAVS